MPASLFAGILIWVVLFCDVSVFAGFPTRLTLHKSIRNDERGDLSRLRARDRVRHGRFLQSIDGIVGFPLAGSYNPYTVGLYYTKVSMGTPAQDFYVQIDTGSDVLWVNCAQCSGCPTKTKLNIQVNSFDPSSSSTASIVSCSSSECSLGTDSSDSACDSQTDKCSFQFTYGDGSGSAGYYVYDVFQLETVAGSTWTSNNSAKVVFGCSVQVTGDLTSTERAVDGIFGFGQQAMSVVSQLASQGVTPQVFSHCLNGDAAGGGILVLGEIVEPGIVYTPLVQSQPHYNLNLESISVNGETLSISSSAFTTSSTSGTIVDSGTTLAYLATSAYDPFVSAITNAVSQSVQPLVSEGNQCYLIGSSVNQVFPNVSLHFAGGASMILMPEEYLLQSQSQPVNNGEVWCIGFQQTSNQELTILGDIVLQNKIIVYDLANQRVGWVNYDCSSSVNVSTSTSTGSKTNTYVNTGQLSSGSAGTSNNTPYITMLSVIIISLLIRVY